VEAVERAPRISQDGSQAAPGQGEADGREPWKRASPSSASPALLGQPLTSGMVRILSLPDAAVRAVLCGLCRLRSAWGAVCVHVVTVSTTGAGNIGIGPCGGHHALQAYAYSEPGAPRGHWLGSTGLKQRDSQSCESRRMSRQNASLETLFHFTPTSPILVTAVVHVGPADKGQLRQGGIPRCAPAPSQSSGGARAATRGTRRPRSGPDLAPSSRA